MQVTPRIQARMNTGVKPHPSLQRPSSSVITSQEPQFGMGVGKLAGLAAAGIFVSSGMYSCNTYNGFNDGITKIEQKEANLDAQYKRRADLIPRLVQVVERYARHEKGVIQEVTKARTKLMNAQTDTEKQEANKVLTGALVQVLALGEQYPNLKADGMFKDLMTSLEGTENRINFVRQEVIGAQTDYNRKLRRFPEGTLGSWMGFEEKPVLKSTKNEEEREAPELNFFKE